MTTISTSSVFTLSKGSVAIFELGGRGSATVDQSGRANTYIVGTQEAFIGPYEYEYDVAVTVEHGSISYRIDTTGSDLTDQTPANRNGITLDPTTGSMQIGGAAPTSAQRASVRSGIGFDESVAELASEPDIITLSRGDHTEIGTNAIVATIKGWMSPFSSNGIPFDVVEVSFKTSVPAKVLVEITDSTGSPLAFGIVSATTVKSLYSVNLSAVVNSVAGDVLYIRYSSVSGVSAMSYPAGGSYTDVVISTGGYREKYLYNNTWQNTTLPGSYRITFRASKRNFNSNNTPELLLAPVLYGQVGSELNVYFDGSFFESTENRHFVVQSAIGTNQADRFTVTPAASGDTAVTLSVVNNDTGIVEASAATIVRVPVESPAKTIKLLAIGDSTTLAGSYTNELLSLSTTDGALVVQSIGTKGTDPNFHEGVSGVGVSWFRFNAASPFVFSGVFNFSQYMTTNSFAGVDVVLIHLGINDIFSATSDISAIETSRSQCENLTAMIASIKAYNPAVKIGIMLTIPPAASQDAFGKNYGAAGSLQRYKRSWAAFVRALVDGFGGKAAENIHVVPTNTCIDTRNNMPTETVAVNSRNAATVVRQANAVHPALSGYQQMADSVWYWLRSVA